MAKSKKKKFKNKHQGPPQPKDKTMRLFYGLNKQGEVDIGLGPCLPNLGSTSEITTSMGVAYVGDGDNPMFCAATINEKYKADMAQAKDDPAAQFKVIQDTRNYINNLKTLMESQFNRYLQNISDMDQALNIWSKNTPPVTDTLDFTEYMKTVYTGESDDPVRAMNQLINSPDFKYDPSWLWSTNEYFDIIISPNLRYKAHRVMYDDQHHSARYCIAEYQRFRIAHDIHIEVPTIQLVLEFNYLNVNIPALTAQYPAEFMPSELLSKNGIITIDSFYNGDDFNKNVIDAYQNRYGDNCRMLQLVFLGAKNIVTTIGHLQTFRRHLNRKDYEMLDGHLVQLVTENIYREFCTSGGKRANMDVLGDKYHQMRSGSIFAAALMISNHMLKQKKLSKPVHTAQPVDIIAQSAIMLQNRPDRKTRILGTNIRITSAERPAEPTMQKIIKYHIPEWGRKEHLRRLKSGKIVRVKAAHCTRKCVDMHGAKSNLPHQAVDYKIQPDKKLES